MINDDSLVGLKMLKSQPSRVINAAKSPGDFTSGRSIWVCVCVCVCVYLFLFLSEWEVISGGIGGD